MLLGAHFPAALTPAPQVARDLIPRRRERGAKLCAVIADEIIPAYNCDPQTPLSTSSVVLAHGAAEYPVSVSA
jgi:hypothetical protein